MARERKTLFAGQRITLADADRFLLLVSGRAEAYAVTREGKTYRQLFLAELSAKAAAYPAMDEFNQMDVLICALEDLEYEELPLTGEDALPPEEQKRLMRAWFKGLGHLPWVQFLAAQGDEIVQHWAKDSVFRDVPEDNEALLERFRQHEEILSFLLDAKFVSEDRRLKKRMALRDRKKKQLVDEAVGNLMNEESPQRANEEAESESFSDVVFAVRQAGHALSLPDANLSLRPEIARKLDQVALLRRLAQKGNMQIRLVTLSEGWHEKDSGVLIGYYGAEKEMAAILPTKPGGYRLVTQSRPGGVPVSQETAAEIDKTAFACYAGFPASKLKIRDLLLFMFHCCWKEDYQVILLASLIAGLVPILTPVITETIFADIIPIMDRKGLATVTQVAMVTSFTLAATSVVRQVAVLRITTHLDMAVEAALWGRLLSLPTKFFRRFQTGELVSRMQGIEAVKSVVNGEFVTIVFNALFSFWSLFLMCYYSLRLTAVAMVLWLVFLGTMAFIYRRVVSFQRELIAAQNKTAGIVQQIFAGLAKFRIQGAEEQAYWLWSKPFGEAWKWNLALRWQNNYNSILTNAQPFLLTLLLYCFVFYVINDPASVAGGQGIGYAQFLAFSAAYSGFNGTLAGLMPLMGRLFSIQPHIENLRPLLEELPEEVEDKAESEALSGVIEASHLTFSYREDGPDVLRDVNFRIAAGEYVAIVGSSGCGKSTLIRLLLGFEQPRLGAVYYDGQDLSELSLPSVRSQLGVVLQNGQLMAGDILSNIVGTAALTAQDAWDAAEAAGVADDIRAMPMEMNTVISEGSGNISGGQRQRILIARALAMKPAVIIFDEATSALDNRTQAIVTESLKRLDATRIVVAHRLSTIQDCDRILVMDQGRIAENGTFDDLLAKGGLFAQLVKRQVA